MIHVATSRMMHPSPKWSTGSGAQHHAGRVLDCLLDLINEFKTIFRMTEQKEWDPCSQEKQHITIFGQVVPDRGLGIIFSGMFAA